MAFDKATFKSQPINRGMVYSYVPTNATLLDAHTVTGRARWNKAKTSRRVDVVVRVPVVLTSATKVERKIYQLGLYLMSPQDVTSKEKVAAEAAIKDYVTSDKLWEMIKASSFDAL